MGNLRALEAVARHLNFRLAAEELALTQGAVSRQVQALHPDTDIRIDATDKPIDLETHDADLALRYTLPKKVGANALRLFGEQLTPVASPLLFKGGKPLRRGADFPHHALIEAGDSHRTQHLQWLTWRRWLDTHGHATLEPKRWLHFNYAHQILQAALAGQGIALARMPLVADSLTSGALVEVFPGQRMDTPYAYFLLEGPRSGARAEVQVFRAWLLAQAEVTRGGIERK